MPPKSVVIDPDTIEQPFFQFLRKGILCGTVQNARDKLIRILFQIVQIAPRHRAGLVAHIEHIGTALRTQRAPAEILRILSRLAEQF